MQWKGTMTCNSNEVYAEINRRFGKASIILTAQKWNGGAGR